MPNLFRAISDDGTVVVSCIDSTAVVKEIKRIFNYNDSITAVLGKLSTAALLMGSMLKGEKDTLTLRMNGDGPVGHVLAVSDGKGNVKAFASNTGFEDIYDEHGQPDVAKIIGKNGYLTVIKDLGLKTPYTGQIPIYSGGIAPDITAYYAHSEQIPNVCGLGLKIIEGEVEISGGYLIQVLPFAPEENITLVEENISKIKSVSDLFSQGLALDQIAFKILEGFNPHLLDKLECEYKCNCDRDRLVRVIANFGEDKVDDIFEKDNEIEIKCDFCNKQYIIKKEDIKKI